MSRKQRRAAAKLGQVKGGAPDPVAADVRRGSELGRSGRFVEALVAFDTALALQPGSPEAWLGRGACLNELERLQESVAAYEKALLLRPDYFMAWSNLGSVLSRLERHADAAAAYDRALAVQPRHAPAWLGRGNLMVTLQRYQEAAVAFDRALEADPSLAEAWLGRGNLLRSLGRYRDALAAYDQALVLNASLALAWLGRGSALYLMNNYEGAIAAWTRTLEIAPDRREIEAVYLHARMHLCDWTDFDPACARVRARAGAGEPIEPFALVTFPSTAAEQLRCARRWVAGQWPRRKEPVWQGERYDHPRIRVAYLSADFHQHATAVLAAGMFERHDASRFEVVAISLGPDDNSNMRARLERSFERFIDARAWDDERICRLIREMEIDILVDLNGLSGGSRTGIVTRRPAPIQAQFLGYPGTMGTGCVDYVIADRTVIPDDARGFYDEKVVHLPDSYQVNDDRRAIAAIDYTRAELELPAEQFVFCCFNNAYKITPAMFDVWMRILAACPESVLWLLGDNAAAAENLRSEAAARGIDARRLVFASRMSLSEHLARHRCADLFLDTLPYNAHTTASDALWAGLPVLTCRGDTFAGRVAASLLEAIRLPELITRTLDEYEALAVELAHNPARLAGLKQALADNRATAPLFDTARFTRHIEAAYAAMMERHRAGHPPDHICIAESRGNVASGTAVPPSSPS